MAKEMTLEEVVEDYFARYTGEREGDFTEYLDENIEFDYRGPSVLPLTGKHQGKEACLATIGKIQEAFEVQKYIIEQNITQENTVAIFGYATVLGRKTGKTANLNWGESFVFENGKITYWRVVVDTYSMMETWGNLP